MPVDHLPSALSRKPERGSYPLPAGQSSSPEINSSMMRRRWTMAAVHIRTVPQPGAVYSAASRQGVMPPIP